MLKRGIAKQTWQVSGGERRGGRFFSEIGHFRAFSWGRDGG